MIPTFVDVKTGRQASAWGIRPFGNEPSLAFWTARQGSCDCTRRVAFFRAHALVDANLLVTPWGMKCYDGGCLGRRRYLVVGVAGDLEIHSREEIIIMANLEYPLVLREYAWHLFNAHPGILQDYVYGRNKVKA